MSPCQIQESSMIGDIQAVKFLWGSPTFFTHPPKFREGRSLNMQAPRGGFPTRTKKVKSKQTHIVYLGSPPPSPGPMKLTLRRGPLALEVIPLGVDSNSILFRHRSVPKLIAIFAGFFGVFWKEGSLERMEMEVTSRIPDDARHTAWKRARW